MKVKLPAQLAKVSSRADKSYTLSFNTRELIGEEAAVLLNHLQSEGWLLYSPTDDLGVADIPTEKANAGMGQKTPASRLRGVLFVLWEQRGKQGDFEDFYRAKMEQIIEQAKEKLS